MSKYLDPGSNQSIWSGVYSTWDEACRSININQKKNGLTSLRWFQRINQQLEDYKSQIKKYGIEIPPRMNNLTAVCSMNNYQSILDFGGSSGWMYHYLKETVLNFQINSYFVIETEEVVNYMKSIVNIDSILKYGTVESISGHFDILYCKSVLQYLSSNLQLISIIKKINPKHILLGDVVGFSGDEFYTVQNYYDLAIPYRFINLDKLIEEIAILGYEPILKMPYASPILGVISPLKMSNFPKEKQLRYSVTILFQKD
jgi:putative methyltransferase (TIGR04325 family)